MSASSTTKLWVPRLFALLAGLSLAASATFWALKLSAPVEPSTVVGAGSGGTPAPSLPSVDGGQLAAFLGARSPAAAESTAPQASPLAGRFVLTGVVASPSSQGMAVIAVDGKPPRPYRVGAPVDEGLVLQSVAPRKAVLAANRKGAALLTLELPAPQPIPTASTTLVSATAPTVVPAAATPSIMPAPAAPLSPPQR